MPQTSLPFHLTKTALATPLLQRFPGALTRLSSAERTKLRDVPAHQDVAIALVLQAEERWVAKYLSCLSAMMPGNDIDGASLSKKAEFFAHYYYGLIRAATAHSKLLQDEAERLKALSPLFKLEFQLKGVPVTTPRLRQVAESQGPLAYRALSAWSAKGLELLERSRRLPQLPSLTERAVSWSANDVADMGFNDYCVHASGHTLLDSPYRGGQGLLTAFTDIPEAMSAR